MKNFSWFDSPLWLLIISFVSYSLLLWLSFLAPINLFFIPAIFLIFYLPGLILIRPFFSKIGKHFNIIGIIGLIIMTSFLLSCIFLIPTANYLIQSRFFFICFSFAVNIVLYLLIRFFDKGYHRLPPALTLKQWSPVVMLALTILILIFINPYAQNADGYLADLKKAIECGRNMLPNRRIFVDSFSYIYFLTGLDYKILFRFLYPLLFLASAMPLLGFVNKRNVSKTPLLPSLFLLIPPVILSEVNIIRPQSALIVCTIPSLLFSYLAIKEKRWDYTILSLAFSLLAFMFHELAIILVISAAIAIVANSVSYFREHKITMKGILLLVVILMPYIYIFWNSGAFSNFFERINYIWSLFHGINFQLWFIDNYKTMDGMELGWPGIMALFYYAYNGLALLAIAIYLLFRGSRKLDLKALSPIIFYIIIFFIIAEIMPRFGFFFIPNRAWVHLMLAVAVLISIIGAEYYSDFTKSLKIILSLLIISGITASIYIALDNVSAIYPEEKESIKYINSLPKNATVISSQDNESLVEIYGDRNYIKIPSISELDKKAFDQMIDAAISNDAENAQPDEIFKEINVIKNGIVINNDRVRISQAPEFCEPHYKAGDPVYFFYSSRKITGMNSDRNYLREIMDTQNKDKYSTFGYEIIYQDQYALLLKLR